MQSDVDAGTNERPRIVIVSNRLPVVVTRNDEGQPVVSPGSGGLVTALAPVLRDRGGVWVGWPGNAGPLDEPTRRLLDEAAARGGFELAPVDLTPRERDDFYLGCANEVFWPLFHDLLWHANVEPRYWTAYNDVNRKFAEVVAAHKGDNRLVWVHDYHLMLVAKAMRDLGIRQRIGMFLHIPFPPLDIFLKLPWRTQVLEGLLAFDLIGFQTRRDRRNFLQCCGALLPGLTTSGKGQVMTLSGAQREVRVGVFPIGIDYHEFARAAGSPAVTETIRELKQNLAARHLIVGVDRLDYTKGIPKRLRAFRLFLERNPDMHGQVTLIQVVVPSRVDVSKYMDLLRDIERLVAAINGRFTRGGWVPIQYIFRSLDRTELLAYYRAADIALITPLKDGMNLVAKEFCAANRDGNAVLILSEFAGAAAQMGDWPLMVNPFDLEGVADAIRKAIDMPIDERRERMHRLRRIVRRQDVYGWVTSFLRAAFSTDLKDIPVVEDARAIGF
jgi:trehalose 6-phosphate synthase